MTLVSEIEEFTAPSQNIFEDWGFQSLTAGSLNQWAANPAQWIADKLIGCTGQFKPSLSFMRGKAVQAGVAYWLYKADAQGAENAGMTAFEDALKQGHSEEFDVNAVDAEFSAIVPMIENAISRLQNFPVPKCMRATAFSWIEGIQAPLASWAGYVFDDIVIEVKSSSRLPAAIMPQDARMLTINSLTRNLPSAIVYVTSKKSAYFKLHDSEFNASLESIIQDAASIQNMLMTFTDGVSALRLYPINPQHWSWKPSEVEKINKLLEIGDLHGRFQTAAIEEFYPRPTGDTCRGVLSNC